MNYTLDNANEYIEGNKDKVNKLYRLKYHMMPPVGWMNDPNGLIYKDGIYHLFYQFYPYDSKWGPMHWGHFETKDFIKYQDKKVALAPDDKKETGCFSGGAILDNNKINLVYTRHFEKDNYKSETVYLATSDDEEKYKKVGKLFDNDNLPENFSRSDFRDPAPYKINNKYYIFVGAKNEKTNQGMIVVLESETLNNFKYSFSIGPLYELGDMGECPSYHKVDGVDVLVASGCHVAELGNSFKNDNSSVFIIGKIDFENKSMKVYNIHECDKGDSFYAPQFIANEEKPIIVGWLEMWGKDIPTDKLNHNWAGALSIPRELKVENNWVYQKPVSLEKYFNDEASSKVSRVSHIEVFAKGDFSINFVSNNGSFKIYGNDYGVFLDTTDTNNLYSKVRRTDHGYKEVKLEILLDSSSVELFINDGEFVISSRIYLNSDYEIETNGNLKIDKHNIIC